MKISTKGRYALRLMLDLAMHDTDHPVNLKDAAARQDISEKYLEQIISALNRAGYVNSVRGPQGGYHLAKAPEEITVGMILRTTEGDLAPVACISADTPECERIKNCVTTEIYQKINDAINDVVDHTTLADMVARQGEMDATTN